MTKRSYIFIFFALLFLKVIVSLYIYYVAENQFFGGGNDADYYHQYAVGLIDNAVNIWPVLLRWMNAYFYYDRGFITLILTILGILIIPLMVAKLSVPDTKLRTYFDRKNYWIVAIIITLYPTLYYQTTDMYRDVFMLFIFLLYLTALNSWCTKNNIIMLIVALMLCYPLYLFRPYLGAATFLTLLIAPFYSFKKYSVTIIFVLYVILLLFLYNLHLLDKIIEYRLGFEADSTGGSNLNIQFSDGISFLPKFILSGLYQFGGLFIYDIKSLFVFVIESLFICIIMIYIIKNKKYSNNYVTYLFIFGIAYSTAWILGNDNLGTAIRLRMFNYIVILIAFFVIKSNKWHMERTVNECKYND